MFVIHLLNLGASIVYSRASSADECTWYFIQYATDVAFVTLMLWGVMALNDKIFEKGGCYVLII